VPQATTRFGSMGGEISKNHAPDLMSFEKRAFRGGGITTESNQRWRTAHLLATIEFSTKARYSLRKPGHCGKINGAKGGGRTKLQYDRAKRDKLWNRGGKRDNESLWKTRPPLVNSRAGEGTVGHGILPSKKMFGPEEVFRDVAKRGVSC